jgi:hypothetical protein
MSTATLMRRPIGVGKRAREYHEINVKPEIISEGDLAGAIEAGQGDSDRGAPPRYTPDRGGLLRTRRLRSCLPNAERSYFPTQIPDGTLRRRGWDNYGSTRVKN